MPRLPTSGQDALLALPEACRAEILRAVVRAAGQGWAPPSDAPAAGGGQSDFDGYLRARTVAAAGRTCRRAAALLGRAAGPEKHGGPRLLAGQSPPWCGSCSDSGGAGSLPGTARATAAPVVAVREEGLGERGLPSGAPRRVGRWRRPHRAALWTLAASATALAGVTAAVGLGRTGPETTRPPASYTIGTTTRSPAAPTAAPPVRADASGGPTSRPTRSGRPVSPSAQGSSPSAQGSKNATPPGSPTVPGPGPAEHTTTKARPQGASGPTPPMSAGSATSTASPEHATNHPPSPSESSDEAPRPAPDAETGPSDLPQG
ncbi:hypothetical protein [Kitasatospora sp. NPDC088346]|uniref:hypothetical protein n=1 Tax=Kitasatospora sp. NPDC088346 TaxID=3364073 RepID=UPI0038241625